MQMSGQSALVRIRLAQPIQIRSLIPLEKAGASVLFPIWKGI